MLLSNETLAWHTSFRIGGGAGHYARVSDMNHLAQAMFFAADRDLPVFVLGAGSNILVSDSGIRGLVIENRMQSVSIDCQGRLRANSGVPMASLVRLAARHGLSGLEWAAGLPGTLGGAIVSNAGAFGHSIGDVLSWAGVLSPDCTEVILTGSEMGFGYRTSYFKRSGTRTEQEIILEAELALRPAARETIEADLKECITQRRKTQPTGSGAGSIFKNPPGDYAGRLIEAVGLKGYRVGGAQISPKHANFMINLGDATAADVSNLIETARMRVIDQFGIWLDLEIEMVGEWE